jgi:hypothetical protein
MKRRVFEDTAAAPHTRLKLPDPSMVEWRRLASCLTFHPRSLSSGRVKASEQASKQASKQASRQASIATLLSLSTTYYGRHHNTAGKDHGISSQIKAFQYAICPLKTPLL